MISKQTPTVIKQVHRSLWAVFAENEVNTGFLHTQKCHNLQTHDWDAAKVVLSSTNSPSFTTNCLVTVQNYDQPLWAQGLHLMTIAKVVIKLSVVT